MKIKFKSIVTISIAVIAILTLKISNMYSSQTNQLTLNNVSQIAYAGGESDGTDDASEQSGWSRFWSNIGNAISSAAEAVASFFEWAEEAGDSIENTWDSGRTMNFDDGSYLQFDPYSNSYKGVDVYGLTVTYTW